METSVKLNQKATSNSDDVGIESHSFPIMLADRRAQQLWADGAIITKLPDGLAVSLNGRHGFIDGWGQLTWKD